MQSQTWQAAALSTLDSLLRALPETSDRWSPSRPSPSAQNQAKMIVSRITREMPEPSIEATIDGGVQFEWTLSDRELDIGILPGGEIGYLKALSRRPIEEGPLELAKLDSLTDWLLFGR
jgi:hypothetical protein